MNPVSSMFEPAVAMTRRNTVASPSCDSPEGVWVTRRKPPDVLLLKCPARFDRIQVRRIGGQIKKVHTALEARGGDTRVVMGGEVVHHEHVVRVKLGEQNALHPANEPLFVRCGKHGREGDPSGQTDRTEDCQILSPVHGNSVDELAASFDPCMRPAHREVHARFVDENQLVGANAPDPAQELPAFFLDVGPQTFQRPAAFFFTTYP